MSELILNHLKKSYDKGKTLAVNDVSLNIKKGELFGLIGPDGAGKSSIFRILTTLILPDSGTAIVSGYDVVNSYKNIRKQVGYMPGKFSLYQDLTVEENLHFFATVFNTTIEENYNLIKDIYIQIEPFKDRRAGKLSGGMKQKLALCCALIHRPKVLFLDEPTTGVDTVSRKEFWDMLQRLKTQGITIVVSTPYMDEAMLCERVALIDKGKIISVDTPENIINNYPKPLYAIRSDEMSRLLKDLRKIPFIESCFSFGEFHHITCKSSHLDINEMEKTANELQHKNLELKQIKPSIEDCFIRLMQ